jgi:hypothetical protein
MSRSDLAPTMYTAEFVMTLIIVMLGFDCHLARCLDLTQLAH